MGLERAGELLEVEGVAAALLVEGGCAGGVDPLAEKLSSLIPRQRVELDPGQRLRAMCPLERGCQTLWRLRSSVPAITTALSIGIVVGATTWNRPPAMVGHSNGLRDLRLPNSPASIATTFSLTTLSVVLV